jgi:hypothetical protein
MIKGEWLDYFFVEGGGGVHHYESIEEFVNVHSVLEAGD